MLLKPLSKTVAPYGIRKRNIGTSSTTRSAGAPRMPVGIHGFYRMRTASVFYRVRNTPFPVLNSTGNGHSRLALYSM